MCTPIDELINHNFDNRSSNGVTHTSSIRDDLKRANAKIDQLIIENGVPLGQSLHLVALLIRVPARVLLDSLIH